VTRDEDDRHVGPLHGDALRQIETIEAGIGYFTSEIGCTQAQRFTVRPGAVRAVRALYAREKSWAAHA